MTSNVAASVNDRLGLCSFVAVKFVYIMCILQHISTCNLSSLRGYSTISSVSSTIVFEELPENVRDKKYSL